MPVIGDLSELQVHLIFVKCSCKHCSHFFLQQCLAKAYKILSGPLSQVVISKGTLMVASWHNGQWFPHKIQVECHAELDGLTMVCAELVTGTCVGDYQLTGW